jgi:hypothetical protein
VTAWACVAVRKLCEGVGAALAHRSLGDATRSSPLSQRLPSQPPSVPSRSLQPAACFAQAFPNLFPSVQIRYPDLSYALDLPIQRSRTFHTAGPRITLLVRKKFTVKSSEINNLHT